VGLLVLGVVGDVLRHVAVEVLERCNVGGVAAVDPPELVVLLPEVGLDDLGGRREAEDRDVAFGQVPRPGARGTGRQRGGGNGGC
jgi:hypothetical protein